MNSITYPNSNKRRIYWIDFTYYILRNFISKVKAKHCLFVKYIGGCYEFK